MKRIGLIGEAPKDTQAIQHLLQQYFDENVQYKLILRNKKGHQLDNISAERALKLELKGKEFDAIIFIRDLDGLNNEKDKIKTRLAWFNRLNAICSYKGILLLNIYELEALILADIENFNTLYKTDISNIGNVMFREKPKEFLIRKTAKGNKTYHESHCPDLFKKLSHKTIVNNCKYYKDFITQLDEILGFIPKDIRHTR